MHQISLIGFREVGHRLVLGEVGSETVVSGLGLIQIHLDQGRQDRGVEALHLPSVTIHLNKWKNE